jgi:RimJ/RimL family protein N-acetyltransferase
MRRTRLHKAFSLETQRLYLRTWQAGDLLPFTALNQDSAVLEHLPGPLSKEETEAFIRRITTHFTTHGFGLWACELKENGAFIGYVGLNIPNFSAAFTPCVEIGWRLASGHWGKGYATEAARQVMQAGFEQLGLPEIVSFTVPHNFRSRRVMEKLGMIYDASGDFSHPNLPHDHPLSTHVLYRQSR